MKVFIDANVLFSASAPDSATRWLLERVMGLGEAVTNAHAWEEARRNLEHKRPHLLPGLDDLRTRVTISHAFSLPPETDLADKDKPILAGAVGARCTHLWTGDRLHFGALYGEIVHGVKVVSATMLADEVTGRQGV